MFTRFTMSGLVTIEPRLGFFLISRVHGVSKRLIASWSIESFFAATQTESNDKRGGGKKKRKKYLVDDEAEDVNGVVELRKQTEAKTSSYEKKFHSRWLNDFSWLKHDNDKGMLCEL